MGEIKMILKGMMFSKLVIVIAGLSFAHSGQIVIPLASKSINLDPSAIQDQSSLWVSRQLNCQLLRYKHGKLEYEAAKTIKFVSKKVIRFELNPGFRFHDGTQVTSDDVIASFSLLKNTRSVLRNIFPWVDKFRKIDNDSFEIILKSELPQFLKVLSAPNYAVFKKEFLDKVKENKEAWKMPMGCGKFKVVDFNEHNIRIKKISGDLEIVFDFIGSNQVEGEKLGRYDIVGLPVVGKIPNNNDYQNVKLFDPYHIFIGLNTTLPRWDTAEERCALYSSLNVKPVSAAYGDKGEVPTDIIPRGILGFDREVDYPKAIEKGAKVANKLKDFKLKILSVSVPENYFGAFSSMFDPAVESVRVDPLVNPKQFGKTFLDSGYDGLVLGLKSNYLDAYEYLLVFSEEAAGFTGFWGEDLKRDIDDSQDALESKERVKDYRRILAKIRKLCLVFPIVTLPYKDVYVKKNVNVHDIGKSPLNEYDLSKMELGK